MAIAYANNTQRNNSTVAVTTLQIVFPNPVGAQSLLVAYAGSTAATRTFTVSDSVNGAWAAADVNVSGGQGNVAILTFPNTAAGTPTVTITMSGAAGEMDGCIEEFTGVQTTTPLDKTATGTGTSVTTVTGGTTATLSATGELCISACHTVGNAGAGYAAQSPFTAGASSPVPTSGAILLATGYNLVGASTAAQTCTFNWTTAENARSVTATYLAAAGGGGADSRIGQMGMIGVGR